MAPPRVGLHHAGDGMAQRQLVHYTMLPRGNERCRENNVRKNPNFVSEIVIVGSSNTATILPTTMRRPAASTSLSPS